MTSARRLKVAIVGTQGVPNLYGGFETLAEFLVQHLNERFDLTVYCSSKDQKSSPASYCGARLVNVPLGSHGAVGMVYDSLTLVHAHLTHDVVLFLGFGAGFVAPFLPGLRKKMILNFGGLDWKRDKWSPRAKKVIQLCEKWLVRNSRTVVADNPLIADYVRETYGKEPVQIAYGGDQAVSRPVTPELQTVYPFLGGRYALSVARIQADNNIDMILEGFPDDLGYPLVFIGNWDKSEYGRQVRAKHAGKSHLILLDAIYDRVVLDVIRTNCTVYIHGHSAGGTNPSLCEAMYLGLPIVAFASGYNERTMGGEGGFFHDKRDLNSLICAGAACWAMYSSFYKQLANDKYLWSKVSDHYGRIFDINFPD